MAKYVGKGGSLTIATNEIGNMRSWSLEETADPIGERVLGDEYESYSATTADVPKDWSGSATAYFDDGDTAQAAMIVGATLAAVFGPRGTTSTFPKRTGNLIITSVGESADTGGMVEVAFDFVGSGALTRGTFA